MLLSRRISYGGILLALIILFIALSYISPTADFALFSLASLCIAVYLDLFDFKYAAILYGAACLLIYVFFGPLFAVPFIGLFGIYPIIKGALEKFFSPHKAVIVKAIYFIVVLIAAVMLLFTNLNGIPAVSAIKTWIVPGEGLLKVLIVISGTLILFIYDYALTLMISFLRKRVYKSSDILPPL